MKLIELAKTALSGSVLLLATLSGNAFASSFQWLEQSASELGAANAGPVAMNEDVGTVFFNPSGVVWLANGKMHLAVGLAAIQPLAKLSTPISSLQSITGVSMRGGNGSYSPWGYNLGAFYQASPSTCMSLTYCSANIGRGTDIDSLRNISFNPRRGGVEYSDIRLPDAFIVSGQFHLNDKLDLLADLSWSGLNKIPKSQFNYANDNPSLSYINENWSDTWRAAFGGVYKYSDFWKMKIGLAFDRSPVGDATYRTPRLLDSNRTWLSMGGQYKVGQASAVNFGYTHVFVREGAIVEDGTLTSQTAPLNLNGNASSGVVQGKYSNQVDMLGVQYSHTF